MDTLKRITHAIWTQRKVITFGDAPRWDENSFLKEWIDSKEATLWSNKPGWYWFESDITAVEFSEVSLPAHLPRKATRFNEVARFNLSRLAANDIFGSEKLNVVYSGQEGRIFSRLRIHFALTTKNSKTGALGISRYPLSDRRWQASLFHEGMIDEMRCLNPDEQRILRKLISERHSRELVEACWRIEYGWPVLCIK